MKKEAAEGEDGDPIRNIQTGPCKKGLQPNVFFSFAPPLCIDDPYVDAASMTKRGKVTQLDPDASFKPPGAIKKSSNKLGYEYVPHMDGVKDPRAVKEALKGVQPLRQIYTNAAKKGGGGVLTPGVLFGFTNAEDEPRRFPEHVPDDYDSSKKQRKAELEHHRNKLQEVNFKSMTYGNNNFSTNEEAFAYDVPTHVPREPKEHKKAIPHECDFKPANPMKKGMLKGLLGEFPEHMPDPVPGPAPRAAPSEDERMAFRIGAPKQTVKPTPSVTTLTRNMRSERPSSFARPLL